MPLEKARTLLTKGLAFFFVVFYALQITWGANSASSTPSALLDLVAGQRSQKTVRVALLGSSLSCGFPFGGPSWWDTLISQVGTSRPEWPLRFEFSTWRGLDMSIRDYRNVLPELLKTSPNVVMIECSSAELLLRQIRGHEKTFPLFDENLESVQAWPEQVDAENLASEAIKDLGKMIGQLKARGVWVLLIGPAACLREFRPLRSEPLQRALAKEQEIMALADLADKNRIESPQYALRCYERLVALEPNFALHHWALARQLRAMGKTGEAQKEERLAWSKDQWPLRGNQSWADSVLELAKTQQIQFLDLQKLCDRISPQGSAGFEVFYDAIHVREPVHGLVAEKVIALLEGDNKFHKLKKTSLAPDSAELWYNVSKSLYSSMQTGIAWDGLHKALELSPHHLPSLKLMFKMALDRQEFNYITGLSQNIFKLEPYDENTWNKSVWMTALERGPEVAELLSKMPSIYWNSPAARFAQGLLTWKNDKSPQLAKEDLEAGLRCGMNSQVRTIMMTFYKELGDHAAMIDMMEKECRNDPKNAALSLALLTRISVEAWDRPEILQGREALFEEICSRHPRDMRILLAQMLYLWQQGLFQPAHDKAQNMLNLSFKFNIPLNREQIKEFQLKMQSEEKLSKEMFFMSIGKSEKDFK